MMNEVLDSLRLADGTLPTYSSVGAYPLLYATRRGNALCAKCAQNADEYDPVTAVDVYWEGEPLECSGCDAEIGSAYGTPED